MKKTKKKGELQLGKPGEPTLKHFKNMCVCCERAGQPMNKEHIFPKWLLQHTKTQKDTFDWIYGKVPADQATVPLCVDCNTQLGTELEGPVCAIFKAIEEGRGFNDNDAELLVRWMWKINGLLYWSICNENWEYGFISLKKHVLSHIAQPRGRISLAISLIEDPDEGYGCSPVGLDASPVFSNIYAVGVFSKLCIAVIHTNFAGYIDQDKFTIYKLSDIPLVLNPNNKVFPKYGFKTGSSAVQYMRRMFGNKSQMYMLHEVVALQVRDAAFEHIKEWEKQQKKAKKTSNISQYSIGENLNPG